MSVFIIAEAGDNHNGSFDLALKLVDAAVDSGADCVKFQTFVTEEVISTIAEKAEYQKKTTGNAETQFEMVKRLELSFDQFKRIKKYCDGKKIMFLSTPFDILSIDFLAEINIPFWKIPSGEITNLPYLIKIAQTGKNIVMSTGMANLDEIRIAVGVLKKYNAGAITLLHCNTEYPTPMRDVNLSAMLTLKKEFGVEVGYSDHTKGMEIPIAAVALGASVIEKHLTLDCNMEGPDHKASMEPNDFKKMVSCIRNIEIAIGNGIKEPSISETHNISVARKSIVARRKIARGECFTEENIAVKRPGNGISPMKWFDVLGGRACRNFEEDELITLE